MDGKAPTPSICSITIRLSGPGLPAQQKRVFSEEGITLANAMDKAIAAFLLGMNVKFPNI